MADRAHETVVFPFWLFVYGPGHYPAYRRPVSLLKGTMELMSGWKGFQPTEDKAVHQAVFWQVITQIVVLDAIFSLDSIITSVGMVKELSIMMLAVIIAVLAMLLLLRPLTGSLWTGIPRSSFLCLGFLLMIGLSLILEGLDYHIPEDTSTRPSVFRLLWKPSTSWRYGTEGTRSYNARIAWSPPPERFWSCWAEPIPGGETEMEMAALGCSSCRDKVFRPEERAIVARVIFFRFGGRTVR